MNLMVSEIIKKANALPDEQAVQLLRQHKTVPLCHLLKMGLCKSVAIVDLPPGAPPYKKSELHENTGMFMTEARKLYLFVRGQAPQLHKIKREQLFINMLEAIHPDDAEMLIAAKDKKLRIKAEVVMQAFPELQIDPVNQAYLNEPEVKEEAAEDGYFPDAMEMLLQAQRQAQPESQPAIVVAEKPKRVRKPKAEGTEAKPRKKRTKKTPNE